MGGLIIAGVVLAAIAAMLLTGGKLLAPLYIWATPWLWSKRRLLRPAGQGSKAVVLIEGFSFWFLLYAIVMAAGFVTLITIMLWKSSYLFLALGVLGVVFAVLAAGLFSVLAVNFAVEKDGENITGRVYLPGRHWRVPFVLDVDLIDYRVRRSVYAFVATLRNGGRVLVKIYQKWRPDPEAHNRDGENMFYHQGQEAVEGALLQQGAEISNIIAQLNDVEFMQKRQAMALAHECSAQVAMDRLPHYDPQFLALPDVVKPPGWTGGPIKGVKEKLEFYSENRPLILQLLDPEPGGEHAGEEGIGETQSHYEELHGIEAEDNGLEADFDPASGKLLHGRLAASIIREVCGASAEIKPTDVLAAMEKAVVVASTGGGTVIPILGGVNTSFEEGHGHGSR